MGFRNLKEKLEKILLNSVRLRLHEMMFNEIMTIPSERISLLCAGDSQSPDFVSQHTASWPVLGKFFTVMTILKEKG